MYPSPQAVALIRDKVAALPGGWGGNTDEQLATPDGKGGLLNAPAVANPAPQGSVPAPLSVMSLMALLDGPALVALETAGLTVTLRDDCKAGDRDAIRNWAIYAALLGHVTAAQRNAILGWLATPVPDPSWQPQISWAVATLGRPVDPSDVAAARPGA